MGALVELDAGIREYLSEVSEPILKCRLIGHCWDGNPYEFIVVGRGRDRVYAQTWQCMRCDTAGVDWFDPVTRKRIRSRSYDYVDGYLLSGRKGGLSREEIRLWLGEGSTGGRGSKSGRRLRRAS